MLSLITDSREKDFVEEETKGEIEKTSSEKASDEGNLRLHLSLLKRL